MVSNNVSVQSFDSDDDGYETPPENATPATMTSTFPPVVGPYSPDRALDDLPAIKYAAALFLDSHMVESEEYCLKADPQK